MGDNIRTSCFSRTLVVLELLVEGRVPNDDTLIEKLFSWLKAEICDEGRAYEFLCSTHFHEYVSKLASSATIDLNTHIWLLVVRLCIHINGLQKKRAECRVSDGLSYDAGCNTVNRLSQKITIAENNKCFDTVEDGKDMNHVHPYANNSTNQNCIDLTQELKILLLKMSECCDGDIAALWTDASVRCVWLEGVASLVYDDVIGSLLLESRDSLWRLLQCTLDKSWFVCRAAVSLTAELLIALTRQFQGSHNSADFNSFSSQLSSMLTYMNDFIINPIDCYIDWLTSVDKSSFSSSSELLKHPICTFTTTKNMTSNISTSMEILEQVFLTIKTRGYISREPGCRTCSASSIIPRLCNLIEGSGANESSEIWYRTVLRVLAAVWDLGCEWREDIGTRLRVGLVSLIKRRQIKEFLQIAAWMIDRTKERADFVGSCELVDYERCCLLPLVLTVRSVEEANLFMIGQLNGSTHSVIGPSLLDVIYISDIHEKFIADKSLHVAMLRLCLEQFIHYLEPGSLSVGVSVDDILIDVSQLLLMTLPSPTITSTSSGTSCHSAGVVPDSWTSKWRHLVSNRRLRHCALRLCLTAITAQARSQRALGAFNFVLIELMLDPSTDQQTVSLSLECTLKLIDVILEGQQSDWLSAQYLNSLSQVLHRTACSVLWDVRDATVEFLGKVLNRLLLTDCEVIFEWVCEMHLHNVVWQSLSDSESYVRASALNSLTHLLNNSRLAAHFTIHHVSLMTVEDKIYKMCVNEPEAFARRAAIKFVSTRKLKVISDESTLLTVMKHAVYDLDWEVKLLAVTFWRDFATSCIDCYSQGLQTEDGGGEHVLNDCREDAGKNENIPANGCEADISMQPITRLLKSGCIEALLNAAEDCDKPVEQGALLALIVITDTLSQYTVKHIENNLADPIFHSCTSSAPPFVTTRPCVTVSRIRMLRTAVQKLYAGNLSKSSSVSSTATLMIAELVTLLQGAELSELQSRSIASTDEYDKNPESLFDDIIKSCVNVRNRGSTDKGVKEMNDDEDEGPIADCY